MAGEVNRSVDTSDCPHCKGTKVWRGVECYWCRTPPAPGLYETLSSTGHMLRRFLGQLVSVAVTNERGQIVNRFAAAQIPDWEIRQQLEDIDAALAKSRGDK